MTLREGAQGRGSCRRSVCEASEGLPSESVMRITPRHPRPGEARQTQKPHLRRRKEKSIPTTQERQIIQPSLCVCTARNTSVHSLEVRLFPTQPERGSRGQQAGRPAKMKPAPTELWWSGLSGFEQSVGLDASWHFGYPQLVFLFIAASLTLTNKCILMFIANANP